MANKLINWIIGLFGVTSSSMLLKYVIIFVISLMPLLELRGGLIAAALLDIEPLAAYIICIVGNIIPIPIILWLIEYIFNFMKKHNILKKFVLYCERKGFEKKDSIEKYGFWGLVLFVGIPLPGTGVWTGCLIAALLKMNKKKALLAAILGTIMSSIIMMLLSYGILAKIF